MLATPGNVMMDTIPTAGITLQRKHSTAVAVLPGSRAHALGNYDLQTGSLDLLHGQTDIFVAVAPGLEFP